MTAVLAIEGASFATDAYPESLFRLYAADRRTLFLIAETAGQKVGYIIARVDRWGAEIVSIAVQPSVRNRGIGSALPDRGRQALVAAQSSLYPADGTCQ